MRGCVLALVLLAAFVAICGGAIGMLAASSPAAFSTARAWLVVGIVGFLVVGIIDRLGNRLPRTVMPPTEPPPRPRDSRTRYEEFKWGKPAPTREQFDFVMLHGGNPTDGHTRYDFVAVIDRINESMRPATRDQLQDIYRFRGHVPDGLRLSEAQADDLIEALGEHDWRCPSCEWLIYCDRNEEKRCENCKSDIRSVELDVRELM